MAYVVEIQKSKFAIISFVTILSQIAKFKSVYIFNL